ncbi:hypothetical protein J7337_006500 [Fusarium musae]|uniref:Uncharacterized protein n=1 Tax=Fusarium musae TaxID=1042133 RepID=A0A9P8DF76_9HYPO|nr:hypothetical protein J7337_006500 [Fusarium musae]KAG9500819.1 hypothetical protein J7337_006500 [Fusarium musae]
MVRHRAGSSRGGSFESDRPSSERRLGNRQPEAQEGGEPPREVELLNQDAAEQPDAPRIGPQPDNEITSFPRLDGSSDGDNPSNDVSQQDPPQRGTGIAPQANDTQTNIGNTSNNVSQQGAPQHGTPKPRSRRESHSTTAGPYAPLLLRDLLESNSSSSASASQANDTQTNAGSPSNDVESASGSSDGDPQANGCNPSKDVESTGADGAQQANNTRTNRAQKSSGSKRGQDSIMSEREKEVLYLMALLR